MATKGRPKVFEDKPVKKNFDLPRELVDELLLAAKKRKQPVVGIVRIALEKELGLAGDASPTLKKVPAIKQSEIKAALLEALEERDSQRNAHMVELSSDLNEKLEKVSQSIGFAEPADFIEEVLRVMLRDPVQLRELVLGKTLLELEAALGITPDLEETQSKRTRKVA